MVRVYISALDVLQLVLIVASAVKFLVDRLLDLLGNFAERSSSDKVGLFESVTNGASSSGHSANLNWGSEFVKECLVCEHF